jgi:XTP/dITP diphosphohydrolase
MTGAAPRRVVLASANPAKAAELAEVLGGAWPDVELVARPGAVAEVVEDAPDFLGNARKKARALCEATGEVSLADDSGLEVDALDGAPGVRSARFAGEPPDDGRNVARLLARLEEVGATAPQARRARFRCVVVLARPDGTEVVGRGSVEGRITAAPRGTAGFGYDPVFEPGEGDGRTFAEMAAAEKHAISHRGRALADLAARI